MRTLYYWLPVILWMGVIFALSSQPYSQQDLRPILKENVPETMVKEKLAGMEVKYAGKEISVQTKGVPGFLEFFIRKGAHIFVFMMLAILVHGAVQKTWRMGNRSFGITFIFCFLYSISDEWHQSFNPHRTASIYDIGTDTVGIMIGLLWMMIINRITLGYRHQKDPTLKASNRF